MNKETNLSYVLMEMMYFKISVSTAMQKNRY